MALKYLKSGLSNSRRELSSPLFDLAEPSHDALLSDSLPIIDISQSFSHKPYYVTISIKLLLLIWVWASLGVSISSYDDFANFWLAYLTNWGWTLTCAYFVFSLGSTIALMKWGEGSRSMMLVKITWALFAIVFPAEVVITLLYWILVFSGGASYIDIMLHGVGAILIFIDAILINRIPLRMKQFLFYEMFSILYTLWTLIFTYSDLTNPYREAGYMDDDAIYPHLRWKTNTSQVIILAVILLLVVNPIVFLLCRWISRVLPRRLVVEQENDGEVELGEASQ